MSLSDLAAIPLVVGVAVGRDKTAAVHGALSGHHVDVLVCDESLARSLLTPPVAARTQHALRACPGTPAPASTWTSRARARTSSAPENRAYPLT